jgi:hypothetical protein
MNLPLIWRTGMEALVEKTFLPTAAKVREAEEL